jgi:8-oxo-dGTP diphosphatase
MPVRYAAHPRSLVFLLNGDDVLLIRRSTQARIFPGVCNGIGGHVERGEDVLASAIREVREETGLELQHLWLRGVISIAHSQYRDSAAGENEPGALVFVFVGRTDRREVTASDEGELCWVALDQLHKMQLVPDLYEILPRILARSEDEGPLFLAK